MIRKVLLISFLAGILNGCDVGNAPIDAETRSRIDSISNARIAQTQLQYDSICNSAMKHELPRLVDSIKKVRLAEIQEQLRTVPK